MTFFGNGAVEWDEGRVEMGPFGACIYKVGEQYNLLGWLLKAAIYRLAIKEQCTIS